MTNLIKRFYTAIAGIRGLIDKQENLLDQALDVRDTYKATELAAYIKGLRHALRIMEAVL